MKWTVQSAWFLSVIFVSYLSLTPRIEIPCDFSGADKLGHFLAYTWLAILPFLGFERTRTAFTGALLMAPLGICLEFAQRHIPNRDFSVSDMIANGTGVAVGIFIARHINKKALLSQGLS